MEPLQIHAGGFSGKFALDNVMHGIAFHFDDFQEPRRDGVLVGVIALRGVQALCAGKIGPVTSSPPTRAALNHPIHGDLGRQRPGESWAKASE
jgi:hypothetical protein